MAYTVTETKTIWGNKAISYMKVVADTTTQTIQSSLKFIEAYSRGSGSMATYAINLYINSGAGGTATNGVIGVSGCTAGDEFYLTLYGTR